MPTDSNLLIEIYEKRNQIISLQIVFVDIVKYSSRAVASQRDVLKRFTSCLGVALRELPALSNEVGELVTSHPAFYASVIKLPTGDGAAVAFPFVSVADLHLLFAKRLLAEVTKLNGETPCPKFEQQGWCNCHANFLLRVGVGAGGDCILYKDVNENWNVAGTVINGAARVMDLADGKQIIFTEQAHEKLTNIKPAEADHFRRLKPVKIKGRDFISYQYVGTGEPYIDPREPTEMALRGLLTKNDLRAELADLQKHLEAQFGHLDTHFEHFDTRLNKALGGEILRGPDSIYAAVMTAIFQAQQHLRVVRLGSRAAPAFVLEAIAKRVNSGVMYDIAVLLRPQDVSEEFVKTGRPSPEDLSRGFLQNHAQLVELILPDKIRFYRPRLIFTDKPVCFDVIIIDQQHIGLGFARYEAAEDFENAIFFKDTSKMAADFANWFVEVVWPCGIDLL